MSRLKVSDAAYLAGIIDGEGSIVMSFRNPRQASREVNTQITIQVVVSMTHEETIRHLARITDTENNVYFCKPQNENNRDQWAWRPGIAQAYDILLQCEPYMVTKKRNAQLFKELVDIRRTSTRSERNWDKQYEIVVENQALNKRGRN